MYRYAKRANLHWKGQSRSRDFDIYWPSHMDDRAGSEMFRPGATLINMIGATSQNPDELQAINVEFVKRLLNRATATGVAHIVLASSASVYGNIADTPLTEEVCLQPVSAYGTSKARMEDAVHAACTEENTPAITILRIGNVAGSDALLATAERHASSGAPMTLHRFPDGAAPIRSYIGPEDLFNVVYALSHPHIDQPRVVNVASPHAISLDVALQGYRSYLLPKLRWVDTPIQDESPARVVLCTKTLGRFIRLKKDNHYADEMALQVARDRNQ